MKKTIVHVIDSLGRGGAETMLVAILPELNRRYNVVLVTLRDTNDFEESQIQCFRNYSLHCSHKRDYIGAIFKLNQIIKRHKPFLVRTQLYWSTVIGRIATPSKLPLAFSVHSKLSADPFGSNRLLYWIEKLTYHKRQHLIAVSSSVLSDYDGIIGIKGKNYVLNNFVHQDFFNRPYQFNLKEGATFKLVAVGNLKKVKNYQFLLNVIAGIKKGDLNFELDIIGDGDLKPELQKFIEIHNLPVKLLGKKSNVADLLPNYDAYIMCSLNEGFGNSPVEAMAIGLPLILNDSDTMKEISKGNAIFFESGNGDSLKESLMNFSNRRSELLDLSEKGKAISRDFYGREKYFLRLQKIYDQL